MTNQRRGRPARPRDEFGEVTTHPVDRTVGRRMKAQRAFLGVSQTWLAERCGLTFQQIQKYEKGGNRVSASRLFEIADILHVPVAYFFQDHPQAEMPESPFEDPEMIELVKIWQRIQSPGIKRAMWQLLKNLGDESESSGDVADL